MPIYRPIQLTISTSSSVPLEMSAEKLAEILAEANHDMCLDQQTHPVYDVFEYHRKNGSISQHDYDSLRTAWVSMMDELVTQDGGTYNLEHIPE